ncbi:MAG: preprotein translocase subunit SecG [Oscillospiraceae bacterium]
MGVPQIIAGAILFLASIVIILIVLMQESKDQGLTGAIGGGVNESHYGKNPSRTRDARLSRYTKVSAFILFGLTIAVNIVNQVAN